MTSNTNISAYIITGSNGFFGSFFPSSASCAGILKSKTEGNRAGSCAILSRHGRRLAIVCCRRDAWQTCSGRTRMSGCGTPYCLSLHHPPSFPSFPSFPAPAFWSVSRPSLVPKSGCRALSLGICILSDSYLGIQFLILRSKLLGPRTEDGTETECPPWLPSTSACTMNKSKNRSKNALSFVNVHQQQRLKGLTISPAQKGWWGLRGLS